MQLFYYINLQKSTVRLALLLGCLLSNKKTSSKLRDGKPVQCRHLKRKNALSGTAVPPLPKGEAKVYSIGSPFGRAVNFGLTERALFKLTALVAPPVGLMERANFCRGEHIGRAPTKNGVNSSKLRLFGRPQVAPTNVTRTAIHP